MLKLFYYIIIVGNFLYKKQSLFPKIDISINIIYKRSFLLCYIKNNFILLITIKQRIIKPIKIIKIIKEKIILFSTYIKIKKNIKVSLYEKIEYQGIKKGIKYNYCVIYCENNNTINYSLIKNIQFCIKIFIIFKILCKSESHIRLNKINSQYKLCNMLYKISMLGINSSIQLLGGCILKKREKHKFINICWQKEYGTASIQKYNQILKEKSNSKFYNYIIIHEYLKKVFAEQINKNIILGSKCRLRSKPVFHINSDDVICSHGVTISKYNKTLVFFFMQRGISRKKAIMNIIVALIKQIFNKHIISSIENKILSTQIKNIL